MPLAYCMAQHVPRAIATGLRLRHIDVLTAAQDSMESARDEEPLDRATELGRVLFTRDDDLLRVVARRRSTGRGFAAVVYAHQLRAPVGRCVQDL